MKKIETMLFGLLCASAASAATIEVPGGEKTIQAAVDAAGPGDTILIAPGDYVENVVIRGKSGLALIGREGADETTVDGDEEGPVLQVEDCPGAIVIEGLTLQRGYNRANGGGAFIDTPNIAIRHCQLLDNEAGNDGGGINLSNCLAYLVEDCLFERNEAQSASAIGVAGGRGSLAGNTIRNNTGGLTIWVYGSGCDIRENLIVRNLSTGSGVIGYQMALAAVIERNTIAMNLGKEASGAILGQFGDLRIERNIIAFNEGVSGLQIESDDGLIRLAGNILWANEGGAYQEGEAGPGDIEADPLFCDAGQDDFRLRPGSPGAASTGREGAGCFSESCE